MAAAQVLRPRQSLIPFIETHKVRVRLQPRGQRSVCTQRHAMRLHLAREHNRLQYFTRTFVLHQARELVTQHRRTIVRSPEQPQVLEQVHHRQQVSSIGIAQQMVLVQAHPLPLVVCLQPAMQQGLEQALRPQRLLPLIMRLHRAAVLVQESATTFTVTKEQPQVLEQARQITP